MQSTFQRLAVPLAFAAVYLIWGSTYLAIMFAIETLPPFLMAGVRFLISGLIMLVWARSAGPLRATPRQIATAAVVGWLLFLLGNGAVVWSEQHVPSGAAALVVALVPVWMVLLEWAVPGGSRPGWRVAMGLLAGTAGLALLLGPTGGALGEAIDPVGGLVLVIGTFCWASGSLLTRHGENPPSPRFAIALQMLSGSAGLLVLAWITGDYRAFDPGAVSLKSILAVGYLVVFGALVGFTSYSYLLHTVRPAQVATYAYVNPVVAVFLGWSLGNEALTARGIIAMVVIVSAVAFISSSRPQQVRVDRPPAPRGV